MSAKLMLRGVWLWLKFLFLSTMVYFSELWWRIRGSPKKDRFTDAEVAPLKNAVAIVTGGNCGIGLETARGLALHGMHVIIACRSPERGAEAVADIVGSLAPEASERVECMTLDLASLRGVEDFCRRMRERRLPLRVLVCNAGIFAAPFGSTVDGFESHFGVNHLGHFALVTGLADELARNAPARVVVVSSDVHVGASVLPLGTAGESADEDPLSEANQQRYNSSLAYANSKFCNVVFAVEADRRLRERGIYVNSLHPGIVNSSVMRHLPWPIPQLLRFVGDYIMKNLREGAATSVYCALSPDLERSGGGYFSNCRRVKCIARATDPEVGRRLWEQSAVLVEKVLGKQR